MHDLKKQRLIGNIESIIRVRSQSIGTAEPIPGVSCKYIGVEEQLDDIQNFDREHFVKALFKERV